MSELSPQHAEARVAHMSGMCVVPAREDGTKAPIGSWLQYQTERPTKEQIDRWYGLEERKAIGVICGGISGNLTMLESEDDDVWQLLQDNAEATGLGALLDSITDGWSERTPGGGVHIYYRCSATTGNKKLARRPKTPAEMLHPNDRVKTLLETRGEGGYTVIAPSGGDTHETGRAYERLSGGPRTVVTITPEEQRDLWQLCSVFDEMEVKNVSEPTPVGLLRPGDDYNNRADWREVLEPHGWRFVFERQGVWYLRRPGKDRGISATVNWKGLGLFRNFSSSTPFDDRAYTKFGVYTILEHAGDYRAAAKTLAERGYGARDQVRAGDGIQGSDAGGADQPALVWRDPEPLERPGFPTFPVHRLPASIRGFCREVAEKIQVPTDYPAMTMLASLSAACRGRYEIGPEERGYAEPLVLQTVLFARSGTRKSASFAVVKRPLVKYERHKRVEDERELEMWEGDFEKLEKDIKRARSGDITNDFVLRDMYRQREELKRERPIVTRIVADDVTPERLGTLVVEQRGPIAVMAPEGGFFANIAGRYNAGIPNLEYVLRGHAGEPLIIDRMGRESYVAGAYVTLGISLQPTLLDEMANTPGFSGKGMAARLLPSFPTSFVGKRDVRQSDPVDRDEAAVWDAIITTILSEADDCPVDGCGDYMSYRLTLGDDARELYFLYSQHVENQLARGGGLHHMDDWGGKMIGHALRIAGLFHLVEMGTEAIEYPVARATLADAIAVIEYFVPHARYMLDKINGMGYGENLDEMMKALREMETPISRSQLHSKLRANHIFKGNKEYIAETLDELELLGYCRVVPMGVGKYHIELNPSVEGVARYKAFDVPAQRASAWTFTLEDDDDGSVDDEPETR